MKRLFFLLALLAVALPSSSQTPAPPGHDHPQNQAHHEEPIPPPCKQMMEEHVAEMKATSQALATNLAQLKATLPLINNVNERSRWQSNIAMWQALADHFSHMARHAEHMQATGMDCGMMMGHGLGSMRAEPAAPAKPQ